MLSNFRCHESERQRKQSAKLLGKPFVGSSPTGSSMRSTQQKYTNSTTFYGLVDFTSGLNNQLDLENFGVGIRPSRYGKTY